MIVCDTFEIGVTDGISLRGDLRYLPGSERRSVIIVCHSFMAFKDWGFFPHLGMAFARLGYASIIFNFSRNGVTGDERRITDFKRFEENTISTEVRDLEILIDAVRKGRIGSSLIDRDRIVVLGHSRGGAVAIIHAADHADLFALVTLASVATLERWTKHQLGEWRQRGYLPLSRDTSVSPLRLGIGMLDDLLTNNDRFDLLRRARTVRTPWLIIHGKTDKTVPPAEAEALYAASNRSTTTFLLLDHAGHLFHARSPGEDGYRTLNGIIARISQWLQTTSLKESTWNGNQPRVHYPSS